MHLQSSNDITSLKTLFASYRKEDPKRILRFGQWFVNHYTKNISWPELFYADESKAQAIIAEWLIRHQYIHNTPERITKDGNEA